MNCVVDLDSGGSRVYRNKNKEFLVSMPRGNRLLESEEVETCHNSNLQLDSIFVHHHIVSEVLQRHYKVHNHSKIHWSSFLSSVHTENKILNFFKKISQYKYPKIISKNSKLANFVQYLYAKLSSIYCTRKLNLISLSSKTLSDDFLSYTSRAYLKLINQSSARIFHPHHYFLFTEYLKLPIN